MNKYRPSNGTDGDCFHAAWCEQCERDAKYRATNEDGCDILASMMAYSIDDPDYPEELTYNENGKPCCTAFIPDGDEIHYRDDKTADMFG